MELLLGIAIALTVGLIVGFGLGKQASGWCVRCGESRTHLLQECPPRTR